MAGTYGAPTERHGKQSVLATADPVAASVGLLGC